MAVTIKDIAVQAGVSPSTVSRVCNGNPSISKETRDRVRKVMAQLGYEPSAPAAPATSSIHMVGIILPPSMISVYRNPFFLETIQNRYANGVTCASIIKRTKPIWGKANYDYDMLFYNGNNKLPRWTGYTLGYMIVTHVLSRSDQDIFELATKRYSYIEYYFNKMLPRWGSYFYYF